MELAILKGISLLDPPPVALMGLLGTLAPPAD
jgi:hypothetical protein